MQAPGEDVPQPSSPQVCMLGYPDRFEAATRYIQRESGGKHLKEETQLMLYALSSQAIKGPCNQSKPGGWGWGGAQEVLKWQSWKGLGDMNSMEAMRLYVRTVEEEQPNWYGILQQANGTAQGAASSTAGESEPEAPRSAADHAQGSTWVNVPAKASNRLPLPRYEHAAAVMGHSFCVVGGNYGGRYLNDVWKLNLKTMVWYPVQTKPFFTPAARAEANADDLLKPALAPIAGHTVTPWNDTLVIIGGHSKAQAAAPSLTVQVMDLVGEVAKLNPGGNLPPPRGGHSACLLGRRIYVFGGEDPLHRPLGDLWYLDLETLTWGQPEVAGKPPSARSAHAAAVYNNRYLLIFGGGSVTTCHSDVHVLDTHSVPMQWSQPKTSGLKVTARAGHSGLIVGSVWYLVGGGNNVKGCTDMVALDLSSIESGTLSWSTAAAIPGRTPLSSEGISLALVGASAPAEPGQPQEYVLLSFGGYNGKYHNSVHVIKVPDRVQAAAAEEASEAPDSNGPGDAAAAEAGQAAAAPIAAAPAPAAAPAAPRPPTNEQLLAEARAQLEAALKDSAAAKENAAHELALLRKQLNAAASNAADSQKDLEAAKASLSREREKVMKLEAEIAELNKKLGAAAEVQKEVEALRRIVKEAESKKTSGGVWGYISGQ